MLPYATGFDFWVGNLGFNKVKWCVDNGMSKQEITIVTGMKSHLIDEYLKIIREINA